MTLINRRGGRIAQAQEQFPRDIICIEALHHTYNGDSALPVLKGISLTITSGQIVSLVGPSGAGKSTLLHILGLMERVQTADQINILGWDARLLNEQQKDILRSKYLGFVFQFHYLLPELTLLENVMLPQRILGISSRYAKDSALELLAAMHLDQRAQHYPSELSGGEQQRGALCRAMMNRPAILICDEPTGNLDIETGQQVRQLIWRLARAYHTTVLIATHNTDLAQTADRMIKLVDGRIVDDKLLQ